ncbi:MAG TPA: DUF3846 domain-containing protein [Galbitalea sp.]|jgi:hypothetical protein|nr:DUF3846 domain-containing protein [Galbitalea sp.]
MVQGLFIPVDLDRPIEVRSFDSLEDYQSAVGGWIEAVDIVPIRSTLYVNEEGLLRELPFNARATFLWWYELPHVRQQSLLVGDAVLVGLPDENGDTTDVPESTFKLLMERTAHVVLTLYEDSPRWMMHPFVYDDYFQAVIWAMELSDRATGARAVRVLTEEQFLDLQARETDRELWGIAQLDDE